MALNIQNNPFKQNDLKLKALKEKEDGGNGISLSASNSTGNGSGGGIRESVFRREEMVLRSVTIANPPEQELVLVFPCAAERERMVTVLQRYAAQFPAPVSCQEGGEE